MSPNTLLAVTAMLGAASRSVAFVGVGTTTLRSSSIARWSVTSSSTTALVKTRASQHGEIMLCCRCSSHVAIIVCSAFQTGLSSWRYNARSMSILLYCSIYSLVALDTSTTD